MAMVNKYYSHQFKQICGSSQSPRSESWRAHDTDLHPFIIIYLFII